MNDWPTALTIALVVSGVSLVLLIVTICVVCKRLNSRKPRREKKLLRDVKIDSLAFPQDLLEQSRDEPQEKYPGVYANHAPLEKHPGVYVNPPGSVPYVDPTPNVKVIKQPHQSGQTIVFRRDLDRWGTHNVVHVDGVNNVNVTPRTSWHQQHKAVHDPEFKDYYYRIYPKGNEENLHEYDYIPIRVESGALDQRPEISENHPQHNHVQSLPVGNQGPTVINFTDSSTSINGGYNNDQELLINPSRLSEKSDSMHRGVETRNSNRQKRQAMLLHDNDNNSNKDSETHSVVENISTKPDGTTEHRVSLNVVFEED